MTPTEVQSLDGIQYKSRIKSYFYPLIILFVLVIGFLNYFPVSDKVKSVIKTALAPTGCNPDFTQIRFEWLLPKLVIDDLTLPASCLGQGTREPLKLSHVSINYQLISFSPFGLPFRIDTEFNGQDLSFYAVQGISSRLVRLKDQSIALPKLSPILGEKIKLAGNLVVDLNLLLKNSNEIQNLSFKAQSRDLVIPAQSIQGFTTPHLKLKELVVDAVSEGPSRINVDRLMIGNPDSPIRANFKGNINLVQSDISRSSVNLTGEAAFSEGLKQSVPVDMLFQSFTQKDGFYQIRLGGTLGSIAPSAL